MHNKLVATRLPFRRPIVEEGYPNPSVSWTANKVKRSSGPISVCVAEWEDTEFGLREHRTIKVPHRELEQRLENFNAEELEQFNNHELGIKSPSRSRAKTRKLVHKSEPSSVLVRAMYLALAILHANPIGRAIPLYGMGSHAKMGTQLKIEPPSLRVQVRRELEGWAIAEGEITVSRVTTLGVSAPDGPYKV